MYTCNPPADSASLKSSDRVCNFDGDLERLHERLASACLGRGGLVPGADFRFAALRPEAANFLPPPPRDGATPLALTLQIFNRPHPRFLP